MTLATGTRAGQRGMDPLWCLHCRLRASFTQDWSLGGKLAARPKLIIGATPDHSIGSTLVLVSPPKRRYRTDSSFAEVCSSGCG